MTLRNHSLQFMLCIVMALALQGCTTTKVRLLDNGNTTDNGFRFREPLPYLLVTSPIELSRTTESTLYTYSAGLGFLPVCDQDMGDERGAQSRLECAKRLHDLQAKFQILIGHQPDLHTNPVDLPNISTHSSDISLVGMRADLMPSTLTVPAYLDDPTSAGAKPSTKHAGGPNDVPDPFAPASKNPTTSGPAPDMSDAGPTPSKADTSTGPLQIVWLPNYCKQYSVTQTSVLSTASIKLQLTNGWQLVSVDASGDSTAVAGKILDVAGAVLGAGKGGGGAKPVAQSTAQSLPEALYSKITVRYLAPGLYPLVKCTQTGYEEVSIPKGLERIEWSRVLGE